MDLIFAGPVETATATCYSLRFPDARERGGVGRLL